MWTGEAYWRQSAAICFNPPADDPGLCGQIYIVGSGAVELNQCLEYSQGPFPCAQMIFKFLYSPMRKKALSHFMQDL